MRRKDVTGTVVRTQIRLFRSVPKPVEGLVYLTVGVELSTDLELAGSIDILISRSFLTYLTSFIE